MDVSPIIETHKQLGEDLVCGTGGTRPSLSKHMHLRCDEGTRHSGQAVGYRSRLGEDNVGRTGLI